MGAGLVPERRPRPVRAALLGALGAGTLVAALTVLLFLAKTRLWTSSSTAPIGLLFVPLVAAMFAVPGALFGAGLGYVLSGWKAGRRLREPPMAVAMLVMLTVVGCTVWEVVPQWIIGREVRRVEALSEPEVGQVLDSRFGGNPFVLAAVALNSRTSAETLDRIARMSDPELHKKLGSFFDDVAGKNRKEFSVMRLVAQNPAVRPDSLERLAASDDVYLLSDVARSPKLSDATVARLAASSERLVLWGLALNPRAPPELLDRLSRSEDVQIRYNVAMNRGAPPDVLRRMQSDPDALVRREAVRGPTAPPDPASMYLR